ncbi:MAG TPA: carboxypeptidase regulatory-like domain-containing protein [Pyrinomonadaceae bacterium]|jgi:hypothetical protein|nr:carboxypeptidase regulatory-like domain-containing protein [Pyrinomonadaceae bacterium]
MYLLKRFAQVWLTFAVFAALASLAVAQQPLGSLRGRVVDQLGAAISNASVSVIGVDGEQSVVTNNQGEYQLAGLKPGKYLVRSTAPGFAPYERADVEISGDRRPQTMDIKLLVTVAESVEVSSQTPGSLTTDTNAGALILNRFDVEVLPEDPEDLAAALRAMAGPVAGPSGTQFTVDGFANTGQPLPTRETIREVRINQNPFSAENDRLGFGLVQIFTRPGTDKLHGDAAFNFSDESLNSRNPFAPTRAPFQTRIYSASLSGPVAPKKASFFISFNRRELNENTFINATILDPLLRITAFRDTVLTPQRRTSINPRLDYLLNPNHTLVVRYSYFDSRSDNFGVGGFSLPERAYNVRMTTQTLQVSETAVINKNSVNEFRFQFIPETRDDFGNNSLPTINVLNAFISGAPAVGPSTNPERRLWFQDNLTWIFNNHTFRSGVRVRHSTIRDVSPNNFGGTYTFAGGAGPQLNANDQPILDVEGNPVIVPLSSIERYRRTLVFQAQGLPPAEIRALGGGASQFSLAAGDPEARTKQIDFGAFIQDDWRLRQSLIINLGMRYDIQTNARKTLNLGPRVAFAWSPNLKGNQTPQTVVRGGFGIFYDRFNEGLTIETNRFNGVRQRHFVTSDPAILNLFPLVPDAATLAAVHLSQTLVRRDPDLRLPYTLQGAFSIERQFPFRTTATINFVTTRILHLLRSRNINAPVPGTFVPGQPGRGVLPFGNVGNIFEFESSGRLNQNQLIISINNRISNKFSLAVNYTLNKARSDTDGARTFPANAYDLTTEYGDSAFDVRHFFFLNGTLEVPYGVRLSPLIVAFSGRPFDITTGADLNGDEVFTDRPALATDPGGPGVVVTKYGPFDLNPAPGQSIIPRNYARGPAFFTVLLTASKTFKFGTIGSGVQGAQANVPNAARNATAEKKYSLVVSVRALNLFNRTNLATPTGDLSSPFFGESTATAGGFGFNTNIPSVGNRRIEAQIRLTF